MRFILTLCAVMFSFVTSAFAANDNKVYTLTLLTTWLKQFTFLDAAPLLDLANKWTYY